MLRKHECLGANIKEWGENHRNRFKRYKLNKVWKFKKYLDAIIAEVWWIIILMKIIIMLVEIVISVLVIQIK